MIMLMSMMVRARGDGDPVWLTCRLYGAARILLLLLWRDVVGAGPGLVW